MSRLPSFIDQAQVIEYLSKKGYNRTEAMLRNESATQDAEGRLLAARAEDAGGAKYGKGLGESIEATWTQAIAKPLSRAHPWLD